MTEETNEIEFNEGEFCALTIEELNRPDKPFNFWIPDYQRGYRWTEKQAKDLVDDLKEHFDSNDGHVYSLQPLVVKHLSKEDVARLCEGRDTNDFFEKENIENIYEVVDGQQRLTTMYLLLAANGIMPFFSIEYQTRDKSAEYLRDLAKKLEQDEEVKEDFSNADYAHMTEVAKYFQDSKKDKDGIDATKLLSDDNNLKRAAFLWYPLPDQEDPQDRFESMNDMQVKLTDAELIKADLLQEDNYKDDEGKISPENEKLRERLAASWDRIERRLQNDDFWYFLVNKGSAEDKSDTRIELLFKLASDRWRSNQSENNEKDVDKDVALNREIRRIWRECRGSDKKDKVDNFWKEHIERAVDELAYWYDDFEKYHLAGFLLAAGEKLSDLFEDANKRTRSELSHKWRKKMLEKIGIGFKLDGKPEKKKNDEKTVENIGEPEDIETLFSKDEYRYEEKGVIGKYVKNTLLAHNVFLILNQEQPGMRFAFRAYKGYRWDVEHICPKSSNKGDWVYGLGNLTLLDKQTNIEYSNSDFDIKKAYIISQEKKGIYILPDIRKVFLKPYQEGEKGDRENFNRISELIDVDRKYLNKENWRPKKDSKESSSEDYPNVGDDTLIRVYERGLSEWTENEALAHLDQIVNSIKVNWKKVRAHNHATKKEGNK